MVASIDSAIATPQDDDIEAPSSSSTRRPGKRLSTVSEMYDINHDGKLDEAELAMRDLDKSGRGYLTNDKVYELMQIHVDDQRKLFRSKKIIIGLVVLVGILALSNLGTSFAAAYLSKDTTTNVEETSDGEQFGVELLKKGTREKISTQTTNDSFEVSRATSLCVEEDGELNCATDSYLAVPESVIKNMFYKCLTGKTVNIERSFSNGLVKSMNICSGSSAVEFNEYDRSTLENNGAIVTFDPMDNGDYKVMGEGLLQKDGEVCDVIDDCMMSLACMKNITTIDGCQGSCRRKRWAQRKVDECVLACDHASCQQAAAEE